jgi:glycerophosphoryl diester phosphodiesterase
MPAPASPLLSPATRSARPLVVGHRGAASYRPEHTASGYELAIDMGADLIEPDVVLSADGELVVRHESELSRTTDVADRPEFAERRTTRDFGGTVRTGWFTEDFTLEELRTLRATERMIDVRPLNTAYDGREGILTLAEVVEIARRRSSPERPVRVLAELKKPTWWAEQGLPMLELVAAELRRLGADTAGGPVLLQTFDAPALRRLRELLGDVQEGKL